MNEYQQQQQQQKAFNLKGKSTLELILVYLTLFWIKNLKFGLRPLSLCSSWVKLSWTLFAWNLFKLMMRCFGNFHKFICLMASWCFLHFEQYQGFSLLSFSGWVKSLRQSWRLSEESNHGANSVPALLNLLKSDLTLNVWFFGSVAFLLFHLSNSFTEFFSDLISAISILRCLLDLAGSSIINNSKLLLMSSGKLSNSVDNRDIWMIWALKCASKSGESSWALEMRKNSGKPTESAGLLQTLELCLGQSFFWHSL